MNHSDKKRVELEEHYNLLSEKIRRLRRAIAIETDPENKFKYEMKLQIAQKERSQVEIQIKEIENIPDTLHYSNHNISSNLESKNVLILLDDETDSITLEPLIIKYITKYKIVKKGLFYPTIRHRRSPKLNWENITPKRSIYSLNGWDELKKRFFKIIVKIANIGGEVLENWFINIDVISKGKDDFRKQIYGPGIGYRGTIFPDENPYVKIQKKRILIKPEPQTILVQKEITEIPLYLEPDLNPHEIILKWFFLARDFNTSGELKIIIAPKVYKEKIETVTVKSEVDLPDEIRVSRY